MPSNKKDPQHPQPKNFILPLRKEQLRSVWWMLQQERAEGKTHTFIEEEISEASLPALGWRAEGKAERPVMVRGGVIADQVGYGKTIISLAVIAETKGEKAPEPAPPGLIDLKATLIVVPGHLSKQWPSEIKRFTGNLFKTIIIQNMSDLNSLSIADLQKADVIVIASDIFKSDAYWQRLEYLSAQPQDFLNDKGGRFFTHRLEAAMKTLHAQVECMQEQGGEAALELMDKHHKEAIANVESQKEAMKAANFGKRLKGAAYRDKYDATTKRPTKKSKTDNPWEVDDDEDDEDEGEIIMPKTTFHKASGYQSLSSSTVQKNINFLTSPVMHMFRYVTVTLTLC